MRISNRAFLLSLALVAACRADRVVAPTTDPPRLDASLNLGGTGATELNNSTAVAINDSGVVVGEAQVSPGDRFRAVEWRPPDYRVTVLPDLGVGISRAVAIGKDGTIGGDLCDSVASNCHPAYWRDGVLHQLGGFGSVKDVCSCDGHTLVGRTTVDGHDHAAIWEDDILIDVGAPDGYMNAQLVAVAHGFIVGKAYNNTEEAGATNISSYRWSPTAGWVLLGQEITVGDVNSRGSAIGGFGAIWLDGSNVGTALGGEGLPSAINDSNVVAGNCVPDPTGPSTSFLPCEWTATSGWHSIGEETFSGVRGINNSNMAVGELFELGRSFAILWRP